MANYVTTRQASAVASPLTPQERLARIERLAELLDAAFVVPGTNFRIGLDSLVGLIPGIGDLASACVSGFIINEARRLGVSRITLMRMMANLGIDAAFGVVPVVGDAFDAVFKSNQKNVALLKKHLARQERRS